METAAHTCPTGNHQRHHMDINTIIWRHTRATWKERVVEKVQGSDRSGSAVSESIYQTINATIANCQTVKNIQALAGTDVQMLNADITANTKSFYIDTVKLTTRKPVGGTMW